MIYYKKFCFDHGAKLLMLVDPDERRVVVTRSEERRRSATFEGKELIP